MLAVIIRTERLDDVVDAVEAIGIDRLTVSGVIGVGRTPLAQHGPAGVEATAIVPRREIEIIVACKRVPQVIAAIRAAAATDKLRRRSDGQAARQQDLRDRVGRRRTHSQLRERCRKHTCLRRFKLSYAHRCRRKQAWLVVRLRPLFVESCIIFYMQSIITVRAIVERGVNVEGNLKSG
jgi:nitrogen regulatory protein PII